MVNLDYHKTSNNQRFIMFMWPLQRGEAHLWPSGQFRTYCHIRQCWWN